MRFSLTAVSAFAILGAALISVSAPAPAFAQGAMIINPAPVAAAPAEQDEFVLWAADALNEIDGTLKIVGEGLGEGLGVAGEDLGKLMDNLREDPALQHLTKPGVVASGMKEVRAAIARDVNEYLDKIAQHPGTQMLQTEGAFEAGIDATKEAVMYDLIAFYFTMENARNQAKTHFDDFKEVGGYALEQFQKDFNRAKSLFDESYEHSKAINK